MIQLTIGVTVLFVLSAAGNSDWSVAAPDPPSAKAQTALVRAFAAIEVGFDLQSGEEDLKKASAELGRALDLLADSVDEATAQRLTAVEARDMSAKLVAIAWDRRRHPERYRELKAYDGRDPNLRDLPPLKKKHLTEAYRLAWEYCLLDPGTDDREYWKGGPPDPPAVEALGKIRNDASIPTLVYYFRHVCRDDDKNDKFIFRQSWPLRVLTFYYPPSEKSLVALLECTSWKKRQWAKLGTSYYREEPPEELIYSLVSGNGYSGYSSADWLKIMAAFPRERLPVEQRQWLEEALKRAERLRRPRPGGGQEPGLSP
ncbi:MAG TPA: hypothetical protein VNK04_26100 [Gemmataceae bacterium]|nr:hypothetical protein [Gemmataceae bacterium]